MKGNKVLLFLSLAFTQLTYGVGTIEVVGGNQGAISLNILPFKGIQGVDSIVKSDLGWLDEFNLNSSSSILSWSVTGNVLSIGPNLYEADWNLSNNSNKISYDLITTASSERTLAHLISDHIVSLLLHKNTHNFVSKIIYSTSEGVKFIDYDGYNQELLFKTPNVALSLSIKADNSEIAYTQSTVEGLSVNLFDLVNKTLQPLAGLNQLSAATFFGNSLVATGYRDSLSKLFQINLNSEAKVITSFGTIATEANINSNGQMLFSSNHDGEAEIFLQDVLKSNSQPTRITFWPLVGQNTTPKWSHTGDSFIFENSYNSTFRLIEFNPNTRAYKLLISANSPIVAFSFSPDDSLLLFVQEGKMYLMSLQELKPVLLPLQKEEVLSAQWTN